MKKLKSKYGELISYLFFGVLTTLVNFAVFYTLEALFPNGAFTYLINNAVAWFVSVIFAYITNKLFVFKVRTEGAAMIVRELSEFFAARVFSFFIEEAGLWLLVDKAGLSDFGFNVFGFQITGEIISKVILAVIVVIMNYFFSKLVIFKKK